MCSFSNPESLIFLLQIWRLCFLLLLLYILRYCFYHFYVFGYHVSQRDSLPAEKFQELVLKKNNTQYSMSYTRNIFIINQC